MQKFFLAAVTSLLAACVAPGEPAQEVDGIPLSVRQDNTYPWPAPTKALTSSRELVNIEPFPLVSALVVERADGVALTKADEALARRAAIGYCAGHSAEAPGQDSRFTQGTWAFGLCASPVG